MLDTIVKKNHMFDHVYGKKAKPIIKKVGRRISYLATGLCLYLEPRVASGLEGAGLEEDVLDVEEGEGLHRHVGEGGQLLAVRVGGGRGILKRFPF